MKIQPEEAHPSLMRSRRRCSVWMWRFVDLPPAELVLANLAAGSSSRSMSPGAASMSLHVCPSVSTCRCNAVAGGPQLSVAD